LITALAELLKNRDLDLVGVQRDEMCKLLDEFRRDDVGETEI
jgi:hypothetical protein